MSSNARHVWWGQNYLPAEISTIGRYTELGKPLWKIVSLLHRPCNYHIISIPEYFVGGKLLAEYCAG
jgi:hypothetical protein